jgi:hypothetical protein
MSNSTSTDIGFKGAATFLFGFVLSAFSTASIIEILLNASVSTGTYSSIITENANPIILAVAALPFGTWLIVYSAVTIAMLQKK